MYCLTGTWEDGFLVAQLRFPRGVLSDGTALFLHDFTDRTPERIAMTFPRSYNATSARKAGIEVRTCADDVLALGLVTVKTPSGNEVRAYDLERTPCDLLRGQSAPDVQVVNPAMKAYTIARRCIRNRLLTWWFTRKYAFVLCLRLAHNLEVVGSATQAPLAPASHAGRNPAPATK